MALFISQNYRFTNSEYNSVKGIATNWTFGMWRIALDAFACSGPIG